MPPQTCEKEKTLQAKQIDGNSLTYLIVEPDGYDESQEYPFIVLLHGFGASMSDLAGLAPAIDRTGYVYLFPNAPIPLRLAPGMAGYAWTPPGGGASESDTLRAEELLAGFFEEAAARHGVSDGGVILGGFSQGGMMTYRFGLPRPESFAGLVVLSGRIPTPEVIAETLPDRRDQPIFIAHGTADAMIGVEDARESRRFLESAGYSPTYREYRMAHEINQDAMSDLVPWMRDVMPPARLP